MARATRFAEGAALKKNKVATNQANEPMHNVLKRMRIVISSQKLAGKGPPVQVKLAKGKADGCRKGLYVPETQSLRPTPEQ